MKTVKGFTLLELIVVIIIIGVLATLSFVQYTRILERARATEAKMILSAIAKEAYTIYLEQGNLAGFVPTDRYPSECTPEYYFRVSMLSSFNPLTGEVGFSCNRCTEGGKPPQGTTPYSIQVFLKPSSGQVRFDESQIP